MMSHLCNRYVREFLILARIWFAFGLPSKPGVTGTFKKFSLCRDDLNNSCSLEVSFHYHLHPNSASHVYMLHLFNHVTILYGNS
jgi:hypothetical protein